MKGAASTDGPQGLTHYLRPVNVWALSLGCLLGWGAFVMPGTTFLPVAGPVGTAIAMAIAAVIIAIIAANFHFMSNRCPDSGGAFAFTKRVFGHDHAFLCAWAIILAYVSIMWANATAFALIIRFLFGPVFQVGYLYQVAGYDVYLGEVGLTLFVLFAFGLLSCARKHIMNAVNTTLAFILLIGSAACLIAVLASGNLHANSFEPAFAPGSNPAAAIFSIVALAPWAFIGFESVSHASGEFSFPQKKLFAILAFAVASGAFIYIAMTLVAVLGTPDGYGSWPAYIADIGNLAGLDGLPTFHALQMALGQTGIAMLALVVFAAISTSLIGLYRASSRLLYTLAEEEVLPRALGWLNGDGVPRNAIAFIMAISVIVPFLGRAAIGWIVDVTTVSAAIVYGYASACAMKVAREEGNRKYEVTGVIGIITAAVFLVYPLVPNIWSVSALAPESYLILAAWSILGLVAFRIVFQRDRKGRFGRASIVWIFMLFLIFFASTMWMRQVTHDMTEDVVSEIGAYYVDEYGDHGIALDAGEARADAAYLASKTDEVRQMLLDNSLVQMGLIIASLVIMFSIYGLMLKREKTIDVRRAEAEETSRAKTTFLSNMSHDIRTPMNAIIGYTHLAKRDGVSLDQAREYLDKIDVSSRHLLTLINDVLEMSRIESGRMEIACARTDLCKIMDDIRDLFSTQMREKGIGFTVETVDLHDRFVMCDATQLNRVLINLVGNAYKFTPTGGSVGVSLTQRGDAANGRASYTLRVSDTGIGMSPEFAATVFEAFERERSSTVSGIEGTGLGMAITKGIIDAMEGSIEVASAPGEGTTFTVQLAFEVAEDAGSAFPAEVDEVEPPDFTGKRVLIAEDNDINFEIASLILEDVGFSVDRAENGQVALDKIRSSDAGAYDIVLMDVQMPIMDGREATRRIRALEDPARAHIPIVGATASAFADDMRANEEAGMNASVAKPLDVDALLKTLASALNAHA